MYLKIRRFENNNIKSTNLNEHKKADRHINYLLFYYIISQLKDKSF